MQPPIADPNATTRDRFAGAETRVFRVRLSQRLLINVLASAFFLTLVGGALVIFVPPFRVADFWSQGAGIVACFMTVSIAIELFSHWRGPLKISRWGIQVPVSLGLSRDVAWSEIERVELKWSLLYHALATTKEGRKNWISLSLRDMSGFADAIAEFAPPDNPLAVFMARRARQN